MGIGPRLNDYYDIFGTDRLKEKTMSEDVTFNPGKIINQAMKALKTNAGDRGVTREEPKLPMPETQEIEKTYIKWRWSTTDSNLDVYAYLYRDGTYHIDIEADDVNINDLSLSQELAFSLGQALAAAAGYKENWQTFAGKFIADGFFAGGVSEPTVGKGMMLAQEATDRGEMKTEIFDPSVADDGIVDADGEPA